MCCARCACQVVMLCCAIKPLCGWNAEETATACRERCGGQVGRCRREGSGCVYVHGGFPRAGAQGLGGGTAAERHRGQRLGSGCQPLLPCHSFLAGNPMPASQPARNPPSLAPLPLEQGYLSCNRFGSLIGFAHAGITGGWGSAVGRGGAGRGGAGLPHAERLMAGHPLCSTGQREAKRSTAQHSAAPLLKVQGQKLTRCSCLCCGCLPAAAEGDNRVRCCAVLCRAALCLFSLD